MAGIQLSGLASGLDTRAIIDQLMSIERQPRLRLDRDQAAVTSRQSALKDILAKLKALQTASSDLKSTLTWSPRQSVASSDAARVNGSLSGGIDVIPGTYDVNVTTLATGEQEIWSWRSSGSARTISITDGSNNSFNVNVAANATVDDAIASINADSTLPVSAVNFNGQMLLRSKQTGATAGSFTVSGFNLQTRTSTTAAQDAAYTVNGTAFTSSTNTVTNAVPGLEISLRGLTPSGPVTITVGDKVVDKDTVKAKLKAFVDAYNSAQDLMRGKLTEKRVANPQNNVDAAKGVLFGDLGISNIASSLRGAIMDPLTGLGNPATLDELRELGIGTGAAASTIVTDNVNGKLTFDEATFDKAWTADSASVEKALKGMTGVDGFAQRMDGILTPLVTTGGMLDGRVTAADSELSMLKASMTRMDDRLSSKEATLKKQFTALESAMAKLQQQQADMLRSLPSAS
jgi:flagellar hook-associated protein 2